MAVNYEDERFQQVEAEKNEAISEIEKTYSGLIDQSDAFYQNQIDASKQWEEQQKELQQQQTDFALQQIEQQKEQEHKDYIKEQSGAYADWKKQSDPHGVNAEKIAGAGMDGSGYSESSQVAMYNAYQNRVATARENYRLILQDFNNAMTEARLQNSAALAQIAYESLQQRLELELQAFLHKSQLELDLVGKKNEAEQQYYQRYQDVLAQINQENALAEQIRQYNASMAEQQRQYNEGFVGGQSVVSSATTPVATGSGSTGNSWEKSGTTINNSANSQKKYSDAIKRGNTTNAGKYLRSLKQATNMSGSSTAIANSILSYMAQGKISSNEAAYLLDYFGYSVAKYLK